MKVLLAFRDFCIHGGVWFLFGWRAAVATFVAHWLYNIWRAK